MTRPLHHTISRKKMTRLFSLALTVLMLVSIVSINACAYTSEYMTIDCPQNYDEEDYSDVEGFYVNVYYSQYALDENIINKNVNKCKKAIFFIVFTYLNH